MENTKLTYYINTSIDFPIDFRLFKINRSMSTICRAFRFISKRPRGAVQVH